MAKGKIDPLVEAQALQERERQNAEALAKLRGLVDVDATTTDDDNTTSAARWQHNTISSHLTQVNQSSHPHDTIITDALAPTPLIPPLLYPARIRDLFQLTVAATASALTLLLHLTQPLSYLYTTITTPYSYCNTSRSLGTDIASTPYPNPYHTSTLPLFLCT